VAARHGDRLVPAGGLGHHGDVGFELEQGDQRLPDHGLVLGDHDAHAHRGTWSGTAGTPSGAAAPGWPAAVSAAGVTAVVSGRPRGPAVASGTVTRSRNPPCPPAPASMVPPRRPARSASPARPVPAPPPARGSLMPSAAGVPRAAGGPAPSSVSSALALAPVTVTVIVASRAPEWRMMLVLPSRTVHASRASTSGGRS